MENQITYPYIPEGRTILYVPEDNQFMIAARTIAITESTDKKTSTGVVVVDPQGKIVIAAANQSAITNPYLLRTHPKWCIRKLFRIPSGQKYWMCPGCASSAYHAEHFAMLRAKKKNISIAGSDVYLWGHWWCCKPCWDAMIKAGIRDVYLMEGTGDGFNNSNKVK